MKARVIENVSNKFKVLAGDDEIELDARGKLKNDNLIPVVGDIIEFDQDEKVIEKIYERKNKLTRPKIANVDEIVVVLSAKNPKPDYLMLDKMISFCEYHNLEIVIVFNKMDLDKKGEVEEFANLYANLGYKVFKISAKSEDVQTNVKLEELKKVLENKLSILAGNSGVGKSTLLNRLFNKQIQLEGEISKKNKKGKNTTTSVKLYSFGNVYLADSPGFSTFNVFEIPSNEVAKTFVEFNAVKCEYVDCRHINEKECNLKKEVEKGNISKSRYGNYCLIYEEVKKEEERW